jgi:hypothetical protein
MGLLTELIVPIPGSPTLKSNRTSILGDVDNKSKTTFFGIQPSQTIQLNMTELEVLNTRSERFGGKRTEQEVQRTRPITEAYSLCNRYRID